MRFQLAILYLLWPAILNKQNPFHCHRFTPAGAQSIKDAQYVGRTYGGSLRSVEVQFFAARLNNEGANILTVVRAFGV